MNRRPRTVTVLSRLFIVFGSVSFAAGFWPLADSVHRAAFDRHEARDLVLVSFVRILAVVAGVFMLRGHNWARWLLVAWLAFHVAISAAEPFPLLVHALLAAVVLFFLFRPHVSAYFRGVNAVAVD